MVAWKTLVDVMPDAVLAVDAHGIVRFANTSARELLGYGASELDGLPFLQLLPERLRESARPPFQTPWTGDSTTPAHLSAPVLYRKGVEIEVDWSLVETEDEGGAPMMVVTLHPHPEPLGGSGSGADQTAARILQLVFEHAPIGIFHFDERAVLTACNERFVEILGSTRSRLIGLSMRTLPDERIRHCIEEALAGRRAGFDGEYRSITGDKLTPAHVEFAPIIAANGEVVGGVGLAEDVSERKDAERRAAQAERMASLGTLAAGVVHEMQNPLAFVVTSLDLAARVVGEGEGRTAIENAREGAWRVATIIRDLKAFARSDDDRRRLVDVNGALESAFKLAQNQLRHRASLRQDLRATLQVRASEAKLVQLFVNLLMNAAQAIPEGNTEMESVTVSTRDGDDVVVVGVEDSGNGLAPEIRERLFEPFVTNKPGGMGLGLAICHGIVSALGGSITARAATPRGTRFEVCLPAQRVEEAPQPTPPAPVSEVPVRTTGRVLVIDDEERLAETLRMALSPPHEVTVCTQSRKALEWIREGREYDVVLCDLMMPELSGPELFEQVKVLRPELAKRFVFLTGGAFTARTRAFLHDVPNPRLEKPFDLGTLEDLVMRVLAGGPAGG